MLAKEGPEEEIENSERIEVLPWSKINLPQRTVIDFTTLFFLSQSQETQPTCMWCWRIFIFIFAVQFFFCSFTWYESFSTLCCFSLNLNKLVCDTMLCIPKKNHLKLSWRLIKSAIFVRFIFFMFTQISPAWFQVWNPTDQYRLEWKRFQTQQSMRSSLVNLSTLSPAHAVFLTFFLFYGGHFLCAEWDCRDDTTDGCNKCKHISSLDRTRTEDDVWACANVRKCDCIDGKWIFHSHLSSRPNY